jgi:hypothetical protein
MKQIGVDVGQMKKPSVDVHAVVECLRDYIQFPSIQACTSKEFRMALSHATDAYRNGGAEAFCEQWDQGDYLLPGQKDGEPTARFLEIEDLKQLTEAGEE